MPRPGGHEGRREIKMEVCLIERTYSSGTWYQIMTRDSTGYNHCFPGKLFTLREAVETAIANDMKIVAIGDTWQCLRH